MEEIQISTFKAKCLQIIDEINKTNKGLKITRHGKPVAVIIPVPQDEPRHGFGIASGTIEIKGDITEPVIDPDDWEVFP
jgi:prevent-host-death family protein